MRSLEHADSFANFINGLDLNYLENAPLDSDTASRLNGSPNEDGIDRDNQFNDLLTTPNVSLGWQSWVALEAEAGTRTPDGRPNLRLDPGSPMGDRSPHFNTHYTLNVIDSNDNQRNLSTFLSIFLQATDSTLGNNDRSEGTSLRCCPEKDSPQRKRDPCEDPGSNVV